MAAPMNPGHGPVPPVYVPTPPQGQPLPPQGPNTANHYPQPTNLVAVDLGEHQRGQDAVATLESRRNRNLNILRATGAAALIAVTGWANIDGVWTMATSDSTNTEYSKDGRQVEAWSDYWVTEGHSYTTDPGEGKQLNNVVTEVNGPTERGWALIRTGAIDLGLAAGGVWAALRRRKNNASNDQV